MAREKREQACDWEIEPRHMKCASVCCVVFGVCWTHKNLFSQLKLFVACSVPVVHWPCVYTQKFTLDYLEHCTRYRTRQTSKRLQRQRWKCKTAFGSICSWTEETTRHSTFFVLHFSLSANPSTRPFWWILCIYWLTAQSKQEYKCS